MIAVTDIRLSVLFFEDLKVRRLQNIHGAEGVLGLQRLWIYAATQRPNGVLSDLSDDDFPLVTEVNAPEFLTTLIRLDFLHRNDQNTLEIVNWHKHQTWVIGAPERSAKARKAAELRWKMHQNEAGKNADKSSS